MGKKQDDRASFTVRHQDGVAIVTLDRPSARNALNATTLRSLAQALRRLGEDPAVDAIVVTGTGPAFCAGLDLRELEEDPAALMDVAMSAESNPWLALSEVPQPVVGAINGPAVTGGLELALVCDVLVASERAGFADTHARVGVLPAQGGPARLAGTVGVQMAKYLSFTGEMLDAQRALELGLVCAVVPHDELLTTALSMTQRMMAGHRGALRALKRTYDAGLLGDRRHWLQLEAREAAAWQGQTAPAAGSNAGTAAAADDDILTFANPTSAGRVTGFFHVAVTTRDLAESLRFYRDGLGLELVARNPSSSSAPRIWTLDPERAEIALLRFPGGEVTLELFQFHGIEQHSASSRPCDFGSSHFCVYVDDAAAVLGRMSSLGYSSRSGDVVTIVDGPLSGSRAAYLVDPDGYNVEIFERAR